MKRIALYAGSFDPPTKGHEWVIKKGAELFETLIVAIGINPQKRCRFSLERRLEWLSMMAKDLPNVQVGSFEGRYTGDFCASVNADILIRGIRNANDFEHEKITRDVNEDAFPTITSIFLIPPTNIADISSSLVRDLIGFEHWERVVKNYIPLSIAEQIIQEASNEKT